jgi:AcrR family transcriptional regulator
MLSFDDMSPRRSVAEARDTHAAIVARAVDLASVEGLEGLTIGRLAGDMQMSKAGVIGHFGTKEELQLQALRAANAVFRREVWDPNAHRKPGLPRLLAICDAWIGYLERRVFPGGCFITAASCEFDGRPGRVREAVRNSVLLWRRVLEDEVRAAQAAGDLPKRTDPALVAFQISAIALATNQAIQLLGDDRGPTLPRAALRQLLERRR